MSYKLFLDDERQPRDVKWVEMPPGPWHIVRDYDGFIDIVKRLGVPDFVSFDHDLDEDHYIKANKRMAMERLLISTSTESYMKYYRDGTLEKTGYHVARWLVEYCLERHIQIPDYQVHSTNPIGQENIRSVIESGKKVEGMT